MLKRFTGIGLVLLMAGGSPLLWDLSHETGIVSRLFPRSPAAPRSAPPEPSALTTWEQPLPQGVRDLNETLSSLSGRSERERTAEQKARLRADMDRLAILDNYDPALARALYGDDWQAYVQAHQRRNERAEFAFTLFIVLTGLGGCLVTWCLLTGFARLLIGGTRRLKHRIEVHRKDRRGAAEDRPAPPLDLPPSDDMMEPGDSLPDPELIAGGLSAPRGRPTATLHCGPRFVGVQADEETLPYRRIVNPLQDHCLGNMTECMGAVPQQKANDGPPRQGPILLDDDEQNATEYQHWETSLASKAADIEKQIAEVKAVAQSVRDSASGGSEPVNRALQDLGTQISAIREFACDQQARVEKLQNGYDWSIIRTFCLRVIRCIDNIELRMTDASGELDRDHPFAEVRDELLFALESSGVEQYEPKVRTPFRGQERSAEVVKEKESTRRAALKGCIARVIKPGYRYVVDEDTLRVVRSARVMLYA